MKNSTLPRITVTHSYDLGALGVDLALVDAVADELYRRATESGWDNSANGYANTPSAQALGLRGEIGSLLAIQQATGHSARWNPATEHQNGGVDFGLAGFLLDSKARKGGNSFGTYAGNFRTTQVQRKAEKGCEAFVICSVTETANGDITVGVAGYAFLDEVAAVTPVETEYRDRNGKWQTQHDHIAPHLVYPITTLAEKLGLEARPDVSDAFLPLMTTVINATLADALTALQGAVYTNRRAA